MFFKKVLNLNILRLFIPLLIFISSCSAQKKDSEAKSLNGSNTSFQKGLKNYIATLQATNRDLENNEWRENVYRNKFYKFRIEFPKGWEYDNGTSKTTLARSLNRSLGATISVFVSHLGESEKALYPGNITKSIPKDLYTKNFIEGMALQNSKPENIDIKVGALNNFPAYLISLTTLESSGQKSYTFISKQIHCHQNGLLYQLALNISVDDFDASVNKLFERTIESFNFENAY